MAERKSRQLTPAKFGPDATAVSDPNLSSASFTRRPVESVARQSINDVAQINALGSFVSGALDKTSEFVTDFKEGFAVKELELEQKQIIQEFLDSRDPNKVLDEETKAAVSFHDQELAFTGLDSGNAVEANVSNVEKAHTKLLNRIRTAKEQGKMSATEFANRTLSATRSAVNKNPGFATQLLQISKRTLDLSGVQGVIDVEAAEAKAQAAREAKIDASMIAIAKEFHIPFKTDVNGKLDRQHLKPKIDLAQEAQRNADVLKQTIDNNDNLSRLKVQRLAEDPDFSIKAFNGLFHEAKLKSDAVMNQATDENGKRLNLDERLERVDQVLSDAYTDTVARAQHIISDPNVEKRLEYFKSNLDAYRLSLTKGRNLEESVKRANGLKSIMDSKQFVEFHTKYNVNKYQHAFMTSVMDNFQGPFLAEKSGKGTKIVANYLDTLTNMLYNMNNPDQQNDLGVITPDGKNFGVETLKQSIAVQEADKKAVEAGEDVPELQTNTNDEMVQNVSQYIQNNMANPKDMTPEQMYKFRDQYVQGLSTVDILPNLPNLSATVASHVITNTDAYVKQTLAGKSGHDFKNLVDQMKRVDSSMKIGFFADGKLSFRSTQFPQFAEALTKRYGTRISRAAKIHAQIAGGGINAGSMDTFYSDYPDLKAVLEQAGHKFKDPEEGSTPESRTRDKSVGGEVGGTNDQPRRTFVDADDSANTDPRPKDQVQRDIDEVTALVKEHRAKVKKLKDAGKDPNKRASKSKFLAGTAPQEVLDSLERTLQTLKDELGDS